MKRFPILPLTLAVAASLNVAAAFAQHAPSDPLQTGANASVQDDAMKAKAKAKKKTTVQAVDKEEHAIHGNAPGHAASASPHPPSNATHRPATPGATSPHAPPAPEPTSMTAPQPGRGSPTPPGVTDPPASSGNPPSK